MRKDEHFTTDKGKRISEGVRRAWADPERRKRWVESLRRAGADPEVRKWLNGEQSLARGLRQGCPNQKEEGR